jgi:hypothetical protein
MNLFMQIEINKVTKEYTVNFTALLHHAGTGHIMEGFSAYRCSSSFRLSQEGGKLLSKVLSSHPFFSFHLSK